MNVDFTALGGTAWTIGGTMILACTDSLLDLYNYTHGSLQMVLQGLGRLFFRK